MNTFKKTHVLLLFIITLVVSMFIYNHYLYTSYVKKHFIELTGITTFETKANFRKENYSVFETIISDNDKRRIMRKFRFESFPIKPNGKVRCNYIPANENDFLYFMDDKGHGVYGYVLYFISKKGNTFIAYENFDD